MPKTSFFTPRSGDYAKVTVIDRGMTKALETYYSLDKSFTKVGFPEEGSPGKATRKGSGHGEFPDMEEVAFVASIHEYGAPKRNIPQRSFFRPALDENMGKFKELQTVLLRNVIDGKLPVKTGLGQLGEFMVGRIKNRIRTGVYTPLRPSTIARKHSDKPLIDRAQMINSVTHIEYAR